MQGLSEVMRCHLQTGTVARSHWARSHITRWLGLVFALTLSTSNAAESASTLSGVISVYSKLPSVEAVGLSTGGTKVAILRTGGTKQAVVITDLASGKVLSRLAAGDLKLAGIQWLNDRYLVITNMVHGIPFNLESDHDLDWIQGRILDTTTGTALQFPFLMDGLGRSDGRINAISGPLEFRHVEDRDYLIFATPYLVGKRLAPMIYKMDLATGEASSILKGDANTLTWLVDDHAQPLAIAGYSTAQTNYYVNLLKAGGIGVRTVASGHTASIPPRILGFDESGTNMLLAAGGEGGVSWIPVSIAEGKMIARLPDDQAAQAALKNLGTERVFGGVSVADTNNYFFFDQARTDAWHKVQQTFPGERLTLAGWSDDFSKLLVLVDGESHGLSYHVIDTATANSTPVGQVMDGIDRQYPTQSVTFQSGDGKDVGAFLTLPTSHPASKLPLVVVVHDGPRGVDTGSFNLWSQILASQGYAVLRVNYRGSLTTTLWSNSAKAELGRKMQSDISDGIAKMVADGTVDAARVCIMGQGYGGYAALAGVTLQEPGIYRCAVSISGFADVRKFLKTLRGDLPSSAAERQFMDYAGVSDPKDTALDQISPIDHVTHMQANVLLIHGRKDALPVEQSEDFYDAMRSASKSVEILKPPSENDIWARADSRRAVVEATVNFIIKNNPPN
jgi:dipeptidyl aminopeptidase/acylaminoacyl peptidase